MPTTAGSIRSTSAARISAYRCLSRSAAIFRRWSATVSRMGCRRRYFQVAKDFPKLKIVISHGARPAVMPVMEVAFLCENVYLSPDLYMNGVNTPGAQEYVKAAHFFLGDRLLFGTAYPSRPLKESVEAFMQWDFDPKVRDKVLYENAARLLNMI